MATPFMLNVVAPAGEVFKQEVEFVVVPGAEGELGILANHAPMVAGLGIGVLRYTQEGNVKQMYIGGGFLEVADNKAVVLAKTAEGEEVIDIARAESAKDRAERRIKEKTENTDVHRAEIALKRAVARLKAARK